MTQDMIAASNLTFNLHEANASDQHQRLQFLEAYAQNHAATSVNCCTALESSVHALGVNLTLVQRELTQQRNESRLQADEMSLLKEMVLRLEEENSQLHIAVGRLNTTNTELQEQNNALHSKVDSLDTRLASLESAIAALTTAATFAPPFDCDSDTDLDNICDEDDSCIADALNDQDSDSVCDGCVPTWSEWSTCTSQCDRGRVFVAADGCPQAETPTTEFQLCFDGGCTFEEALVALQFGPSSTTEDIENALQTVCDNLLEIGPEPLGTCSAEVGCDGMSFSSVSIIIESSFVTSVSFTIVHNGEGEGDCSAIPSANEDVDALISSASAASCQEECEDCQDEYEVETTVTVQQNCDRVVDTSITSPLPLDGTAFLDTLSDSPDLDVSEPEITSVTADLVVSIPPLYGNVGSLIAGMGLEYEHIFDVIDYTVGSPTTPLILLATTSASEIVTLDATEGADDLDQYVPLIGGIAAGFGVLAALIVVVCWLRRHQKVSHLRSTIQRSKTEKTWTQVQRSRNGKMIQMTPLKPSTTNEFGARKQTLAWHKKRGRVSNHPTSPVLLHCVTQSTNARAVASTDHTQSSGYGPPGSVSQQHQVFPAPAVVRVTRSKATVSSSLLRRESRHRRKEAIVISSKGGATYGKPSTNLRVFPAGAVVQPSENRVEFTRNSCVSASANEGASSGAGAGAGAGANASAGASASTRAKADAGVNAGDKAGTDTSLNALVLATAALSQHQSATKSPLGPLRCGTEDRDAGSTFFSDQHQRATSNVSRRLPPASIERDNSSKEVQLIRLCQPRIQRTKQKPRRQRRRRRHRHRVTAAAVRIPTSGDVLAFEKPSPMAQSGGQPKSDSVFFKRTI